MLYSDTQIKRATGGNGTQQEVTVHSGMSRALSVTQIWRSHSRVILLEAAAVIHLHSAARVHLESAL